MITGSLKQVLRHRLKTQKSSVYVKWLKGKYPGKDLDHLLESVMKLKLNDYLLVPKSHKAHMDKHYKKDLNEDEFLDEFITALNLLFDYIKELEDKNN